MRHDEYDDDEPYVIIEKNNGSVGSFLIGLAVGAGVALLLAPSSGRDLRDDLGRRIRRAAPDLDDPFTGDAADSIAREGETRSAT